jgi:uncharacterized protein
MGTFVLGLVIAGVVGGLASGMMGVGGGIVVVPVLYHVLDLMGVDPALRMHIAVGTSLAAMIPTSLWSSRTAGTVDWDLLRRWAAPMAVGAVIGSALSGFAAGQGLALFFAVAALLVAAQMVFVAETRRLSDRVPAGVGGALLPLGIGSVSAAMGVGGDAIGLPALTLCGVPLPRAAGTAAAFGAIIGVLGTIGAMLAGRTAVGLPPYSLGYVNLLAFIVIAPAGLIAARFGTRIAHMTDRRKLRLLFAGVVAVLAARMLYDALGLDWV